MNKRAQWVSKKTFYVIQNECTGKYFSGSFYWAVKPADSCTCVPVKATLFTVKRNALVECNYLNCYWCSLRVRFVVRRITVKYDVDAPIVH